MRTTSKWNPVCYFVFVVCASIAHFFPFIPLVFNVFRSLAIAAVALCVRLLRLSRDQVSQQCSCSGMEEIKRLSFIKLCVFENDPSRQEGERKEGCFSCFEAAHWLDFIFYLVLVSWEEGRRMSGGQRGFAQALLSFDRWVENIVMKTFKGFFIFYFCLFFFVVCTIATRNESEWTTSCFYFHFCFKENHF